MPKGDEDSPAAAQLFKCAKVGLGAEQMFRWDRALVMADALEDEEISRKLALRGSNHLT